MKQMKIVTIGGGSSYTPELIEGFIKRKDELNIKEIWLVDIEEGREKLEIVGALSKRMIEAAGLGWELHLTLDRKEALKNADFVTTQFRVGLLDARIKDERIPFKYGMLGQETNGLGGIFKALRTIPVILNIIEDMKELCPKAWLINFTNPAGMVTEAAIKYGKHERTIGLCNVPISHINDIGSLYDKPLFSEDFYVKFAGLNHFHWHRCYNNDGEEMTKEVIKKLYGDGGSNIPEGVKNIQRLPFDDGLLLSQSLLPCYYHQYYYMSDDMLKKGLESYEKNETRAEVVKATEERLFELYKDVNLNYKPEELTSRGGTYYSDAACECVSSIANDKRKLMVVSTQNNGALSDLGDDSIVEVSSYITSHGAEPVSWGAFSSGPRGMLQLIKAMEECVIEAAVTGDVAKVREAMLLNPLVDNSAKALEALREMFLAHEEYLPQFVDVIAELKNEC